MCVCQSTEYSEKTHSSFLNPQRYYNLWDYIVCFSLFVMHAHTDTHKHKQTTKHTKHTQTHTHRHTHTHTHTRRYHEIEAPWARKPCQSPPAPARIHTASHTTHTRSQEP